MDKTDFLMEKVGMLLKVLPDDLQDKFADHVIDFVEDYVSGTSSSIDDMTVLPICQGIRSYFNIPDND